MPISTGGRTTAPVQDQLGFPGVAYSVQLFSPLVEDCYFHERKITELIGTVTDESGTQIDAGFTLLPRDMLTELIQLDFVPPHEGDYSVQLFLRPTGQRVDTSVVVVNDRRDAGVIDANVNQNCITAVLAGDVLLCTWPDALPGYALTTFKAGVPVANVQTDRFAVSGDRVWSLQYGGQSIIEYQLSPDGQLVQLAHGFTADTYGEIAASGDEAVVAGGLTAGVFTTFDGGLVLVDTVANAVGTTALIQFAPDGGAVFGAQSGPVSLCIDPFPDGGALPCTGDFVSGLGTDSSGLWFATANTIGATGFSEHTGQLFAARRAWPGDPVLSAGLAAGRYGVILAGSVGWVLPRFNAGAVHLDAFPAAIVPIGEDARCVYEQLPGKVRCWQR
jgi:hypothetical protein